MKTQIEEFKNSQAFNNKTMLISLLIFACILLFMPLKGKWFSPSESLQALSHDMQMHNDRNTPIALITGNKNKDRENIQLNYIPGAEVQLGSFQSNELETHKLVNRIAANIKSYYGTLLYSLADVEEPELLIANVRSLLNEQNAVLGDKALFVQEEETAMAIENWMTDPGVWKNSAPKNESHSFTADLTAFKKSETDKMEELIRKTKSYAKLEVEAPLKVEHWMLCESIWCTEKQATYRHDESFALNEEK